jgi:uncharacterized protein (TIGR03437 family)
MAAGLKTSSTVMRQHPHRMVFVRICYCVLAIAFVAAGCVSAQNSAVGPPVYSARTVIPNGLSQPTALAPGMVVSVYGEQLGPQAACTGSADTQRRERPSSARPNQTVVETQIFPTKLCQTEVRVGGVAAGLLYVQARQLNFKVPQESPVRGTTHVQVVYRGLAGPSVTLDLTDKPNSPSAQQLAKEIWSDLQAVKWNSRAGICGPVAASPIFGSGLGGYSHYCSQSARGVEAETFYFPVGVTSPSVLLRRADFRLADNYPTMSEEVEQLLERKLTGLYGPGTIPSRLFEIGAQLPHPGLSWRVGEVTLFLHRNRYYAAPAGVREGVALIAVRQEVLDERERKLKLDDALQSSTRLSHPVIAADLSKEPGLHYLMPGKPATTEAERLQAEHETLASLLNILKRTREPGATAMHAALLVAADDLVVRLGGLLVIRSVQNGGENLAEAPDMSRVRAQLATYGVQYTGPGHYSADFEYDRGLLRRAWKEAPATPWGQHAFLMLQRLSCDADAGFRGPECFRDVITQGEEFLRRYPETTFRKEQLYHLALANETWWSLSHAAPGDPSAEGARVDKPGAERARLNAIRLYEELAGGAPESIEAHAGQFKLPRLKLRLDTGERTFFCMMD